jgi:hypothetical protein
MIACLKRVVLWRKRLECWCRMIACLKGVVFWRKGLECWCKIIVCSKGVVLWRKGLECWCTMIACLESVVFWRKGLTCFCRITVCLEGTITCLKGVVLWREGLTCWCRMIACLKESISAVGIWLIECTDRLPSSAQSSYSITSILGFKNTHSTASISLQGLTLYYVRSSVLPPETYVALHKSTPASHWQKSTEMISPATQKKSKSDTKLNIVIHRRLAKII